MRNYVLLFLAAQALTGSLVYAQFTGPFSCSLTAGAPALRAGGAAELLGELRGECTGGSGTITTDLDLSLNSPYTGRILTPATNTTETLLIIGDPAAPTLGTDIFQATLTSPNSLRFSAARYPAPGSAKLIFRIVNLRVSTPASYSQMLAFFSSTNIPFNNPQQLLGFPANAHSFQITTAAGAPTPALSFNSIGTTTYRLRFDESSQNAFRRRNTATTLANPTALAQQSTYGQDYQTESGFYLPTLNPSAGLADHGTRLMTVFSNLPSGVSLAVRAVPNAASSTSAQARLITTATDGSGPYSAPTPAGDGTVQLPISANSARAVWEVLASDPAALENLQFDLLVTTTTSSSASAGVTGQLAPLNPKQTADATSPLPRFTAPAKSVSSCGVDCITVPSLLKVTYTIGGPSPAPLAIPIQSTGSPLTFTATATSGDAVNPSVTAPDAPWLSLPQSTGTTPATLTATLNPAGLSAGNYLGQITISAGRFTSTISVVLQVNASPTATAPPACTLGSGVPPSVRSTGITERLMDLIVICDPLPPGPAITTDLRVTLKTIFTSRPNEVLLLVNEPGSFQQSLGSNVFRGERLSPTQVVFRNVALPADGNPSVLRIVNLNADISRVAAGSANSPTQLQASVRASAVPISFPASILAFIQPGHTFSLLDANNAAISGLSLAATGKLRFVEGFYSAFNRRNVATTFASPDAITSQAVPGAIYNTETGFYNPALPNDGGPEMGLATQGTRLIARFTNIPPGVGISVSVNEAGAITPKAQLVQTDANGAGPFQPIAGPTAPVTITNGSGIAVWEILSSNQLSVETLDFTYQLTAAVPATASVEGLLGPLSTITTSDAAAPLPRFAAANSPNPTCNSVSPCLVVPGTINLTSNGVTLPTVNVPVTSDDDPATFQVSQPTVPWLSVPIAAGATPGQFTVTANPAGLAPGTYTTQLFLNVVSTTVNFTVQAPGPAALLLPTERAHIATTTGDIGVPISITISGTPGLSWQAAVNVPWLQITQTTGTVPATFSYIINSSLLPAGQYEGRITFTAPGVAPVTYAVGAYVTPSTNGYTLAGTITGPGATPLPGITVTLSGSESRSAVTAADGTYRITGLTTGGPYTVTPSAPGYLFSPAARSFTTLPPSSTQTANFTAATAGGPPAFLSVLPATANGSQATFTVRASDPDGAANISRVYFLINSSTTIAANSCHGFFDRATRNFFLYNDALTARLTPQQAGATGAIENTQCRILGPGSAPGADTGTESNFQVQFALKGAYANQSQNVYFWAQDNDGNGTGWLKFVTWTPLGTNPPSLIAANFLNDVDVFRILASDPDNNLSRAYFLIAPTPTITTNGCHGYYDYATNQFALYDDSLTSLGTENSTCAIDVANSGGIPSGDFTLALRRKGNMPATKAFVWLVDATNLGTGWLDTNLSFPLRANPAPTITSGAPALATGPTQTFTAQITDSNTRFDITRVYFLINPTAAIPANTCHGFYDRATGKTYLYNDSLTAISSTVLENSQCRLQPVTQATTAANGFTFSLNATRKGSYLTTDENVYLWALDAAGNGTGWVPISGWATTANAAPTVVAPAPPALTGSPVTFSFTARDANGAADIDRLYFLLNPTPAIPANTCHGFYEVATNRIYLYNDALNALLGPLSPGTAQTIQNTQCALNGATTSVVTAATDVTLNLNVTVKTTVATNAYLWPVDKQGAGTGWVRTASWGVQNNQPPTLTAPAPIPNLTGANQSLTATVTDLNGASDISRIYFLLNADISIPQNSCHGFYDRATNAVYLYNDALTALEGPLTPGSGNAIGNTRCQINGPSTGVLAGPSSLQLTLGWTRKTSAPAKLYLWAVDSQSAGTGWVLQANHN